jgi:hypothetical protein
MRARLYFFFFFTKIGEMKYLTLLLALGCLTVVLTHTAKGGREKTVNRPAAALDQAKEAALETQVRKIAAAVDLCYEDRHEFPETLESLVPRYLATADELVDSWGTRMALKQDGRQNLILVSAGKDRIFDSPDDVERRIE